MGRFFHMLRSLASSRPARWIGVPVVGAAAIVAVITQSQTVLPPTVSLAAEPLYARGARAKPTLTLALSVEFPTVGAQYRNATYSTSEKYLGYFDAESCYTYVNDSDPLLRRFDRAAAATNRTCGGTGFSGNFMNWATSSSIDLLRYGLTGGDRAVDTGSLTVLQRAVLRTSFFRSASYFPSKVISPSIADGAVPNSLRGTYTGDIYIANCLNRVHFGTEATGTCDSPGNNANLGAAASAPTVGVVSDFSGTLPSDFSSTPCAVENDVCAVSGLVEVAYGAASSWKFMTVTANVGCNNTVFGDPLPLTVKACHTRPRPVDNYFYTRVRVCESSSGILSDPRTGLCQRYPAGNYKPVGNLQKYSDLLRVAAFGYLNDNTGNPNERYGGVLRAPMKYVGPKAFDANFSLVSGTNPVAEWNESTGVFVANPEGQTSTNSGLSSSAPGQPLSGVVNYLNQFGRTGTAGQYKSFDPVGELYYESLRYIQGLAPTPEATSSVTDTMKDGYPVYTSWTDPHPAVTGMTDYSCVKNNIVGIGDVFTHWDKSIPGNANRSTAVTPNDFDRGAGNDANNEPNFHEWTKVVGGFESNTTVGYIDGKGIGQPASAPMNITANSPYNAARWGMENQTTGSGGGAPAPDKSSAYYMAGMAYWANTHDIRGSQWSETTKQRPGMRVTTYMIDVNENSSSSTAANRINTHFYLAAKYGGFRDSTGTGNPFREKQTDGTIVDNNNSWANASGEAKNYFLASSAQALLDALDEIFKNAASEANSIAGGAISTQRLTTSGGQIYQAQFDPADWSGDLVAYPVAVSASGGVSIGVPADSPWRNSANKAVGAAGKLDDLSLSALDARKIYIGYNSTAATPVFNTTEFKWASLNDVTKNALRAVPYAASAVDGDTIAQARLNYLRGDRANEASGTFRRRGSRLGDIVNSGVAFAGAPSLRFSDSSYATFYAANKDRKKALYVGANDGMLHAFDADTGSELFAYVPSFLAAKLGRLTTPAYVHESLMDGSPEVAEAKVGAGSDPWKTVLVAGAGGGGQGVFALDISNPDLFDDSKVMWEFTDRHDPEMGNVVGRPQILKFNISAPAATPEYKYFAVFASGVNNYAADGYALPASDTNAGKPVLFLLDLSKPKSDPWVTGTSSANYFKIRFPLNSTTIASGMANFTVRLGNADQVTQLYAGDLQGSTWKLDFTKAGATSWSLDTLSYYMNGSTPIPMYIAKDGLGNLQPITMHPALVFGSNRNIIVTFGTGKYLEQSDNAGPYKAQSVYALLDNNSATADMTTGAVAAIAGRGRLKGGVVTSSGIDVPVFTWARATEDDSSTSTDRSGWYFDFFHADTVTSPPADVRAGSGERQISGFGVLAGQLIFGSVIPPVHSCDNGLGNLYAIDLKTGDGSAVVSDVGILGEPFLAQVGASTLSGSDTTGRRRETTRYQIILQGSGGLASPPSLSKEVVSHPGRLSWREITNYQELKKGS